MLKRHAHAYQSQSQTLKFAHEIMYLCITKVFNTCLLKDVKRGYGANIDKKSLH